MKLKLLQIVTNHSGYQFLKQISIKIRLFHEFRKLEGIFFVLSYFHSKLNMRTTLLLQAQQKFCLLSQSWQFVVSNVFCSNLFKILYILIYTKSQFSCHSAAFQF